MIDIETELKKARKEGRSARLRRILNGPRITAAGVAFFLLATTYLVSMGKVTGRSMEPYLLDGQRFIILKYGPYERGDVIVYVCAKGTLIGRITAAENDKINLSDILPEDENSVILGRDEYFVAADNQDYADSDDHLIGIIGKEQIIGRIIWPIE